ncbi:hypothetical protein [Rubrivirga marina]|uniref:Uncharacterized protein n=1 Tax=Rubrivirga marina TaxID=1196024 RepID=A0A271J265_9BACT|nr:hypothetical protein [Rubrivirga marina]PAP77606.1 hypothetical protein BSZ37_14725 [Rubrivirga marina]
MPRLLVLAALALLLSAPAEAQIRDSLLWFRAGIMFETVDGGPGRAVWKAPANAPAARSISFGQGRRFSPPIELRYLDSLYVGSGRVPGADRVSAVRVQMSSGTLTVRAPQGGWDEGVAAARAVFEPNDANAQQAEVRVWTDMRPGEAQFNIGMPPSFASGWDVGRGGR